MTDTQPRTPPGVPTGGQFATSARAESDVALGAPQNVVVDHSIEPAPELPVGSPWHTSAPVDRLSLDAQNQRADGLVQQHRDGALTLDAPYQRGSVWSADQRRGLIRSMLQGTPVPAVIINDRLGAAWRDRSKAPAIGEPYLSVVDGKQRIEALRAWFDGDLAVPASWFDDEYRGAQTRKAADGTEWVTYDDLSEVGQRLTKNRMMVPVAVGNLDSERAEAELYLLVNGAGTAQTDADMDNAREVAQRSAEAT